MTTINKMCGRYNVIALNVLEEAIIGEMVRIINMIVQGLSTDNRDNQADAYVYAIVMEMIHSLGEPGTEKMREILIADLIKMCEGEDKDKSEK